MRKKRETRTGSPSAAPSDLALVKDPLLRLPAVRLSTGYGTSSIYAMIRRGEFPAPIKRGNCALWLRSSVERWIDAVARGDQWRAG